jgi:uncharacterized protein Usg
MFVEIRRPSDNTLLKTLLTLSNANASYYWKQSAKYDLLAYKGQTIRIRFYATNDYSYTTDFIVDDLVIKVGAKTVPAATSFKINNGAATTVKATVTLNNKATNSPTHYMASESSTFVGATWQTYATAPTFILSPGAGTKTVYFKVQKNLEESLVMNDTIEALPPATSFKINNGAASTAKGTVTLNNKATNSPTHYMASESPTFVGATWQTYATAPKFNLSDGAGTKTVYFKVKNGFDQSAAASGTIVANGLPPVLSSFKINNGAASTGNGWVTLNNTSTNSPMYYMASEDSTFAGATWQTYATAPKFPLSLGSGEKKVYFKVKNIFGESGAEDDTISASGLPPVVTSFKINNGAASTVSSLVTLNNAGTNSPMYYKASEDPTFFLQLWQTYSTAPKFTLSAGAGTKTVYFKTRNIFGESTVESYSILLN